MISLAKYYGVERSTEYLAHHGIKGMRWGVRRALKRGDKAALQKQHAKAEATLQKLKEQTDRKGQKQHAKELAIAGALGLGTGALGGLASYGIVKGQLAAQNALTPNAKSRIIMHPVGLYGASGLAAGAGLGALAASIPTAYRGTKKGNQKAIERYNRFKKAKEETFRGVKIGKPAKQPSTKQSNAKQDLKYAAKTAALSTVMGGPAANMYMSSRRAVNDPNFAPNKKRRKNSKG